ITVITGPSGSGKTFLLLALLGADHRIIELSLSQGSVIRPTGGVAYVDQQPWCASGTIRSQIVFYSPWDESRYRAVVRCCICPALPSEKNGDFTETGAGSSTLSGGQQARIAIARALYSSHRYIFLDEPLAAVDNETARYLLKYC
ncbi:P-loop containing nucleoside triphosphate hydrolase protein, partial [Atractiella rhizophila]